MTFERRRSGRSARIAWLGLALCLTPTRGFPAPPEPSEPPGARPQELEELEELLAEERAQAELDRRRGELRRAFATFDEHVADEPADAESRLGRARCWRDEGRYDEALADYARALEDLAGRPGDDGRALRAAARRELGLLYLTLGRLDEAGRVATDGGGDLDPVRDPRDAWFVGRLRWLEGQAAAALETFVAGTSARARTWSELLARARCQRRVGDLVGASRSLQEARRAARDGDGAEPDVLVELASLFFEVDGEIEHREAAGRAGGPLLREALSSNPRHVGAALELFRIGRLNWHRTSRSPHEWLADALASNPNSVEALILGATADLEDGQLPSTRERLERLEELAGGRREVRTLRAVLAWVEHDRERARALLAELADEVPADSRPERELGRILCELYRFSEALEFCEAATKRDPGDHRAWTQLGRSLANTGHEDEARRAFERAKIEAQGRVDVWRDNMELVLRRLASYREEEGAGQLAYSWSADAAEVLSTYWKPFYAEAREELARRYGFTPGDVRIEVFREHQDFSVRSTGYEGFPALGVCFGPVVTAVSPLSGLRGSFSWARTAFHEFTHVVHLGLSHNRCPRWITEGLATWEEAQRRSSWSRPMRQDLVNAYANDDLIPVRELNRAFRGPRILFGYYQGGLLCEMLIEDHGFPPMVRLLEAFDRGLDLDQALDQVFGKTPEEIDAELAAFVGERVADLFIEPVWNPTTGRLLRLRLADEPPPDEAGREVERAEWAEGWTTVAWSAFQDGRTIDAEQALRRLRLAGIERPRASFLRAEMAAVQGRYRDAAEHWEAGLAVGGRDFRANMALGQLAREREDYAAAERYFLAAEEAFPGFPDQVHSAELALAQVYGVDLDDPDRAFEAKERWLVWQSGHFGIRLEIAGWHELHERFEDAARHYELANEVDPFCRRLHRGWGDVLFALERYAEAAREFRVARLVPPELDADQPGELPPRGRAELLAREAECYLELGELERAAERVGRALDLDPDSERAQAVAERLP